MKFKQSRSALVTAALAGLLLGHVPASAATPDRPEPGKQGETMPGEAMTLPVPYSKGVNLVGYDPIGGRSGNLIMAWSGACAYVADGMTLKPDGFDFAPYPNIRAYLKRIGARQAYQRAMQKGDPGMALLLD